MSTELTPLKPDQPTVTFIPKVTTDLPFFNLIYNRKNIPTKIHFEGSDPAGNPMRWEVYHDQSSEIGYPGVQAHQVWYLLIKPSIDYYRRKDGSIPKIIPLGGVRHCLRMLGWSSGGRQAREMMKCITQISFSGCVADLWVPTGRKNQEGKEKFLQIKGRFSRLSLYAIGEHHLTQEELKDTSFDFDLEDVVYIELSSIEAQLQQLQFNQSKLIDNEYMFSVNPSGRRWYELLAGAVFGTVKNNNAYFEIKYSWYVKRHHTLKKFNSLKRVTHQMNRVVRDHLRINFLTKVEYRKQKLPGHELDFVIRYYPGKEAIKSINRIKGYLDSKERRRRELPPQVKRAHVTPAVSQKSPDRPLDREKGKEGREAQFLASEDTLTTFTKDHEAVEQILITRFGITSKRAYQLAAGDLEECRRQIKAMEFRETNTVNKAGFLIKAIEERWEVPEAMIEAEKAERRRLEEEARQEKERIERQAKQAIIDRCRICPETGIREVKSEFNVPGKPPRIVRAWHECSHDPEKEARFEDYYKDDQTQAAGN